MKRGLITDLLFPSKFAKWRINEIRSFIDNFDMDILVVNKIHNYCGNNYTLDYNELKETHMLDKYDILIFNPIYNSLNQYNTDINGIKYNGKYPGAYLFRLKKYRQAGFELNYDFIYHIFIICFETFNTYYKYDYNKQYIHLYPGGGRYYDIVKYPNVNIISTQYFISNFIKISKLPNKYINIYGAPYIYKDELLIQKTINTKTLKICFTSLGNIIEKGADIYIKIAEKYKNMYPNDDIIFYGIGIVPTSPIITKMNPLPQSELDIFYRDNIDIIFNLDRGNLLNGWPLGVEGAIYGALLLTTNNDNMNILNNYNFNEFLLINSNNIDDIINKIKMLYIDRELLNKLSIELQTKVHHLFSFDRTMKLIFEFIQKQ